MKTINISICNRLTLSSINLLPENIINLNGRGIIVGEKILALT